MHILDDKVIFDPADFDGLSEFARESFVAENFGATPEDACANFINHGITNAKLKQGTAAALASPESLGLLARLGGATPGVRAQVAVEVDELNKALDRAKAAG